MLGFTQGNLEAKVNWVEERLCMDSEIVARTIQRSSSLLCLSVDLLESIVTRLQERLHLSEEEVAKVVGVRSRPQIFGQQHGAEVVLASVSIRSG